MSYVIRAWLVLASYLLLTPATVDARDAIETTATYYHPALHGQVMANGARYDRWDPHIAACNWLPLGTLLKVTRLDSEAFVYVRVQDRGSAALTLDLSEAAFRALGLPQEGRIPVRIEIISAADDARTDLTDWLLHEREAVQESAAASGASLAAALPLFGQPSGQSVPR
jgi:rare lipoprotein A